MTLDEKLSLLHGGGWGLIFAGPESPPSKSVGGAGFIPGIPRLGIQDLQMADAAVGVTRSALFGRYSTALPPWAANRSAPTSVTTPSVGGAITSKPHNDRLSRAAGT